MQHLHYSYILCTSLAVKIYLYIITFYGPLSQLAYAELVTLKLTYIHLIIPKHSIVQVIYCV